MSDNFSVSVELKGKTTGLDGIAGMRTELLKIGSAAKEAQKQAAEAARGMAASLSSAFKGDITTQLRAGIKQTKGSVDTLTKELRNLYALKAAGNPVANLSAAIRQVEQEIREAQFQLNQFTQLSGGAALPNLSESMGVGAFVKGLVGAQIVMVAIREIAQGIRDILVEITTEGLKMNEELEAFELGIAANITALYELQGADKQRLTGEEKYREALKMSKAQMLELRKAGLATAATSQELGKAFQSALAVSASSSIKDLDTIRQLTIGVANAATAMVIPQEEAVVALRAIISGREVEQSTLARTLVGTGQEVRMWKEKGRLVEELLTRLEPYTEAANRNANAWKVVKSNIMETFQVFSGEVTAGLFGELKKIGLEVMQLLDPKTLGIVEKYQPVVQTLKGMFTLLGQAIRGTIEWLLRAAGTLGEWMKENETSINEWKQGFTEVWVAITLIVETFKDVLVALGFVTEESGAWQVIATTISLLIRGIAIGIAAVADGVRAVGTALILVGGLFAKMLLEPAAQMMEANAKLAKAFGLKWGATFDKTAQDMRKVYTSINQAAKNLGKPLLDQTGAMSKLMKAMEQTGDTTKKAFNLSGLTKDLKAAITDLMNPPPPDTKLAEKARELAEKIEAAKADASAAMARARLEGETRMLEDQLKIQEISITDYYTRLTQKALEGIALERAARERELASKGDSAENEPERIKIQNEINLLRLKESEIIEVNRNKQRDALKDLQNQINDVDTQLKELQGSTSAEDIVSGLQLKFENLRNTLTRQFGEGSKQVNLLDKFIDVKAAKESFALVKTEYENTLKEMQAKEAEIKKLQAAGTLSPIDAINQLNAVQLQYTATLDALLPRLQAYAEKVGSPELKQQLAQMQVQVKDLTIEQNEFGKAMGAAIDGGWVDLWQSIADGTKTADQAFKDFAKSILSTFTKLMTEIIAKAMMAKMLEGMGSAGGGGWGSIFSSIFSGMAKADGGYIMGPGTGTSDSIPARLSNGEYVIKAASVKRLGVPFLDALNGGKMKRGGHLFADGGLAGPEKQSTNNLFTHNISLTLDRGIILEAFEGPDGARVLSRLVGANSKRFNRALGRG